MPSRLTAMLCIAGILSFSLSGCFDVHEIDDQVYAMSVGVDKGTYHKVRLTVQYPTYKSGGGDSGGGQKEPTGTKAKNAQSGSNVHTIEAPTMLEAVDMLSTAVSRRISLMHTKWYIFSEEFAKQGIDHYISGLERFRETRGSSAILITKGTAEDFIKENESNIGESLSKSIELLLSQSSTTGYFPDAMFTDFYRNLCSPYQSPIGIYAGINNMVPPYEKAVDTTSQTSRKNLTPGQIPRSGVSKRELAGMAIFDGGKMVGSMDSFETALYLMITGKYNGGRFSIPDRNSPDKAIVFDLHKSRTPKVEAYFRNGTLQIDVNIKMESEIYAIQSRIDYEKLPYQNDLEGQIEEYLLAGMRQTINRTQREFHSDIFGFGKWVAGNFATIDEWEAYNWLSKYKDAKVNLSLDVKIRRTGLLFHSSPIYSSSGKGE